MPKAETLFDAIVRRGNRPPLSGVLYRDPRFDDIANRDNWITCADGFRLSVIAGDGAYCRPRPSRMPILGDVASDYTGPYHAVEVGYPSERPEPWACPHGPGEYGYCSAAHPLGWQCVSESGQENGPDTWQCVYPAVPVGMVRDLIALHGGEQKAGDGMARDLLDDLGDADEVVAQ